MKIIDNEKYLSAVEIAEYLKLSKQTVLKYFNTGLLPKRKIGSGFYALENEVKKLLEPQKEVII